MSDSWVTGQGRRAAATAWLVLLGLLLGAGLVWLWWGGRGEEPRALQIVSEGETAASVAEAAAGMLVAPRLVPAALRFASTDPVVEPEDPIEAGHVPATEQEHYRVLRALGERDPVELSCCTAALLAAPHPRSQQIAALRALYDSRAPRREELFRRVLLARGPQAHELATFALRYVSERAATDPVAARLVRAAALEPDPGREPGHRRRAMAAFAKIAEGPDLAALASEVVRSPDPLMEATILSALEEHRDASARGLVLGMLGRPVTQVQNQELGR